MRKIILTVIISTFSAFAWAATAQETLSFYKQELGAFPEGNSREIKLYAASLADNLDTWFLQNPVNASASEVMLLQTRLLARAGKNGEALAMLFRLHYLFPAADMAQLSPLFNQTQEALDKSVRETASRLFVQASHESTLEKQTAQMLYAFSKLSGKEFYPAAVQAFERFFVRYPNYEGNNEIELWYGDLHRVNGNYLAAILQYKKASALYPNSPYKAASMRLIGDVYADNLKNTAAATEAYTNVLRLYPNSVETGTVYKHMAILDENNKQYDIALLNYNKAIELLQDTTSVYEAYRGKADVYYKTKQYDLAYDTLQQAAALSKLSKENAADSYAQAAKIAHKKLKDETKYIQSLGKAVLALPDSAQTAKRMYELATAYEKAGRTAGAQEMYQKLILQFPTSKYASSAQNRLTRLGNTK